MIEVSTKEGKLTIEATNFHIRMTLGEKTIDIHRDALDDLIWGLEQMKECIEYAKKDKVFKL